MTDLRSKAEKYETKSARCEESARQAREGPERKFFEALAQYYRELAETFRQVLAKRQTA